MRVFRGLNVRSIVVPAAVLIAIALLMRQFIPVHHGGAGVVGVLAIIFGTCVVVLGAFWARGTVPNKQADSGVDDELSRILARHELTDEEVDRLRQIDREASVAPMRYLESCGSSG